MRIAIVGAGSLGCLFAALLKERGQDLVLVERNRQIIRAIRSEGIWLVNANGEERNVRVDITLSPRLEGPVDAVLLFVKSYDTAAAVRCTQHVHGPETLVGSFQNGVGNLEAIAEVVPRERIFSGSLAYSSMQVEANRVRYTGGSGTLRLAKFDNRTTPEFERIVEVFGTTGYPVEVVGDCQSSLWNKLLMNAGANALSVVTGLPCGELVKDPALRGIMDLAVRETADVARRKGVRVDREDDPAQPLFKALEGIGANKTTMLQDFERGAQTEIEAINGAVVREGARLGVATPVNRFLYLLVQHLTDRRQSGQQEPRLSGLLGSGPQAPSPSRVSRDETVATRG